MSLSRMTASLTPPSLLQFQTLAWFGGAALMGHFLHNSWHNSEDPSCAYTPHDSSSGVAAAVRSTMCFHDISRWCYMALVVAIITGCMLFYGTLSDSGLRGPFSRATMPILTADNGGNGYMGAMYGYSLATPWGSYDSMGATYRHHIRRYSEMALVAFAVFAFWLWTIIADDGATGQRLGRELPYIRTLFYAWIVVIPTACTLFMENNLAMVEGNISIARASKSVNFAAYSLLLKTLLFVVLTVFVDPVTQIIYVHTDDSGAQETLLGFIVSITALVVLLFWRWYLEATRDGVDMVFAFNDFAAHLTFTVAIAWALTARLQDRHDPQSVTFDFVIYMTYLWLAFVGVWCTPPSEGFVSMHQLAPQEDQQDQHPLRVRAEGKPLRQEKPSAPFQA